MTTTMEVTFIGICTHLWKDQPSAPAHEAFGHRIVLPNASSPEVIKGINDSYGLTGSSAIQPHVAKLQIFAEQFVGVEGPVQLTPAPQDMLTLTLQGVTVTTPGEPTELQKDARCMPGLGSFVPNVAPGPAATSFQPAEAACYFDFRHGLILGRALSDRAGAGSILHRREINGEAFVTITPFDGSEPSRIFLRPGARPDFPVTVVFTNFPESGKDDNINDFVLHYLVTNDQWPAELPSLGPIGCIQHPHGREILQRVGVSYDFGVGCSNSNIP